MKRWRKSLIAMIMGAVIGSASFAGVTSAASSSTYNVQHGDTMGKIAAYYQVTLGDLIQANPQISDPSAIYPGQAVTIPSLDSIQQFENKVIELTNIERTKAGLPALKGNGELSRVAQFKSQDMIDHNYFDHQSPTYGSPFDMMTSFGIPFSYAGENIAAGQKTPEEVVNGWMNSPGHRANILNPNYTEIGVGLAKGGQYGFYWTQQFIR
ncbi:CAP domain-containing protein [Ammoniphilus resinae]|uniref:YkwD family protein/spore coat assembly protein SafA n=1 Tax=Ammoniphilus resinae TaxID=861532 RepID=A0ABS4GVM0_9BACL|nr:CAP domain-containing protein [Ammoniphilus resinae]MBP1934323.1 putative YkwD family protein/spore coat assembly protein SafA [Ammoniphilus resinae]